MFPPCLRRSTTHRRHIRFALCWQHSVRFMPYRNRIHRSSALRIETHRMYFPVIEQMQGQISRFQDHTLRHMAWVIRLQDEVIMIAQLCVNLRTDGCIKYPGLSEHVGIGRDILEIGVDRIGSIHEIIPPRIERDVIGDPMDRLLMTRSASVQSDDVYQPGIEPVLSAQGACVWLVEYTVRSFAGVPPCERKYTS